MTQLPPSASPAAPEFPTETSVRLVAREFVILAVLAAAAVAGFLLTREVAERNRSQRVADAGVWYVRGQDALKTGAIDAATNALRKATLLNPGRLDYRLSLARALVADQKDADAREILASVRGQRPDDPEATLQLARIEVRAGREDDAVRLYQGALVALWAPRDSEERRRTRIELIDYLLANNRRPRALSELLLLNADLPEDAETQAAIGHMFLKAGDPRRAAAVFADVLTRAPENGAALAGSGEAAFAMGNYALALRDLSRVPADTPGVAETRAVAQFVLDRDPLAPRLGARERLRRIESSAANLVGGLDACVAQVASGGGSADNLAMLRGLREALTPYLEAAEPTRRPRAAAPSERDAVEDGLDVLARVARARAAMRCGPATPLERAIELIVGRHALEGA